MPYAVTHLIVAALYEDAHASDYAIADRLSVSRSTVRNVRRQLIDGGHMPDARERRGKDGTYRTVPRRKATR